MAFGDFLKRLGDYFGLTETDDYEEDDTAQHAAPSQSLRQAAVPVRDIGSRRMHRDEHYSSLYQPEERRGKNTVIRPLTAPQVKMHLMQPKVYNETQIMGDKFKAGIPVFLVLQAAPQDTAARIFDFATGLVYALDGHIQPVAQKVFILVPSNVEISAEDSDRFFGDNMRDNF